MPREFYRGQGGREHDEQKKLRSDIEQLFRLNSEEREIPESAEELDALLQEFDFEWLLDYLQSLSRPVPEQGQFEDHIRGLNGILWDETQQSIGSYNFIHNVLRFNPVRIEQKVEWAKENGLEENVSRRLILYRALIHEYLHVYSMNRCQGLEMLPEQKTGVMKTQTGLEESRHKIVGGEIDATDVDFEYLNEGLVDVLAEGLFSAYIQDQQISEEDADTFFDFYRSMDPYEENRMLVWKLVEQIAEDGYVDEQTVFNAFIRQLKGIGKLDQDVQEWFVELVGEEIFKKAKGRKTR